jgi:alginate lyase
MPRHLFSRPVVAIGLALVVGLAALFVSATSAKGKPSTSSDSGGISAILDPSDWYLTLPTGHKGDPDTVEMPKLAGFSCSAFHLNDAKDGVVFTANAGGVTTSGSSYPRSELREMDGSDHASWTNTHGTHTLTVRQAVTTLPKAKPDVVTAQIHDANDDVLEVRIEGSRLTAQYNDGKTEVTLDPHYKLGTAYDLTITASGGRIRVDYNGAKKLDIAKKGSGWYFKSGSYIQSNTSKGDKASAVAVVVIYRLAVKHSG